MHTTKTVKGRQGILLANKSYIKIKQKIKSTPIIWSVMQSACSIICRKGRTKITQQDTSQVIAQTLPLLELVHNTQTVSQSGFLLSNRSNRFKNIIYFVTLYCQVCVMYEIDHHQVAHCCCTPSRPLSVLKLTFPLRSHFYYLAWNIRPMEG